MQEGGHTDSGDTMVNKQSETIKEQTESTPSSNHSTEEDTSISNLSPESNNGHNTTTPESGVNEQNNLEINSNTDTNTNTNSTNTIPEPIPTSIEKETTLKTKTETETDTTPTISDSNKEEPTNTTEPPHVDPAPSSVSIRDHIFDHFIVAGIPPYAQAKRGQYLKPEVLYQFPPDKQVPGKVTEFCFPNGVRVNSVKRSASGSSLNELLFGQPHLHSASNSHVFYLTGEFQTLYGCCVTKDEFLRCTPNFLQTSIASHPLPQLPQYLTAPRCYCFLSRFPIFPMHFDVLFALLAQDRLITITLESQSQLPPLSSSSSPSPADSSSLSSSSSSTSSTSSISSVSSSPSTPSSSSPASSTSPTSSTSSPAPSTSSKNASVSTPSGDDSMESLDVTFQKRLSLSGEVFNKQMFQFTYAKELHDILDYYYSQHVLQPGQSVLLKIPGDIKKHTTFYCPVAPSIYEAGALQLADWCLTPLFKHLSLDNILKIFAAALLEHKLIFLCENLNTLSAAVLSIIPLLYPFVWQGIYIPVLPINLHEYLDAPVPFIMGLQSLRRRNLEAIIVDLNSNKLIFDNCSQPVAMPEYKKLYYNLEASHKTLFDVNNKNHNPFNNTGKMLAAVHEIVHTLQAYIFWLIKKVEDFFNQHPAEISDSLSVEGFKQKFLATVSGPNKDFVRQFLDTQLFSFYLHSHMGPSPKGKRVPLG